jgi:hypothetical protein
MRIHNEEPSGSGGYAPMSPTDTTSGEGVTVHMDGGEYNDEAPELGKEVPPTWVPSTSPAISTLIVVHSYDSIPRK